MPGKADRFVVDAFHQAAVACDRPCAVIDQIVPEGGVQVPLRHRHAHGHGQPLPQRAGGAFHAIEQEILRMARARAAELPEIADIVHRRPFVAGQVEQRIDQHRTVAGRQHEPVAIGPFGRGRIEFQIVGPQHGGNVRHAHRHAGMPAIGGLHCIHRERADGIGHGREAGRIEGHCCGLLRGAGNWLFWNDSARGFLCGRTAPRQAWRGTIPVSLGPAHAKGNSQLSCASFCKRREVCASHAEWNVEGSKRRWPA